MKQFEGRDAVFDDPTTDELAELKDLYLRTLADFDNYRKRVERERDEIGRAGRRDLLLELLDVVDSFDRAVASVAPPDDTRDPVRAGVLAIYRQIQRLLERNGVERYESVGERFDPERHDAVATGVARGVEPGTILEEERPGYTWHGKLLRPARVFVAADGANDEGH